MTLANHVESLETALEDLAKCRCTRTRHVARSRLDALMNLLVGSRAALEQLGERVKRRLDRDPTLRKIPWRKELLPEWILDAVSDQLMLMSNWTDDQATPTIVTQAEQAVQRAAGASSNGDTTPPRAFSLATFLAYVLHFVPLRDARSCPIGVAPPEDGPDVAVQLASSEPGPLESLVAAEESAAAPPSDTFREQLLRSAQLTDAQLAVALIVFDGADSSSAALLRGKKSDDRATRDLINRAVRRLAA